MSFGARLAQKRLEKGLTQAGLGVGLGTGKDAGKGVVYGWEKDQHYPRVDQLILICNRLNCSADYLLYGIASSLPFSHDLLTRINEMSEPALQTLENVMRAHLRMPPIPLLADPAGPQVTAAEDVDKVALPVQNNRDEVDLKGVRSARNTDVQVPKQGRGRKA